MYLVLDLYICLDMCIAPKWPPKYFAEILSIFDSFAVF